MGRRTLFSTANLMIAGLAAIMVLINSCKKDVVPPKVTTASVSDITTASASSGGNVTADGGAEVTARGVCWGLATLPTISDSKTSDSNGVGTFTSSLTGLTENTKYYVRAYATNKAGTGYGEEITFTTKGIVPATITTTDVSSITPTSAVSGGNITNDGGGTITARGVCWAATANPTVSDSKTTDGSGTGSFSSSLTGLTPGTTYHVRAYATNSAGTSYGDEKTFSSISVTATLTTVDVTGITRNSASSGGNITSDGGSAITARGVCWSTSTGPVASGSHTSDGTGSGSFTSNITGLTPNTKYYVRAYASNSAGTSYGNELSFTTSPVGMPAVTTTDPGSVTSTAAISGGNVTSDGGATVTARGVCWATTSNPTTASGHTTNGTGTGIFSSNITGLQPGTLYHVRAYATNSAGTAYGDDLTFTTLAVVPTLTTASVTSIAQTTATSGGNITSTGGAPVTARGVCWNTSSGPTISNQHTSDGAGSGTFTSSITGLTSGVTYYVRAYATNSAGTAYGNELSFTSAHETGSLNDVDGNTYVTVKIGNQWWMAENLKTTKYNDNTAIPIETVDSNWMTLTTDAYCWYQNDEAANKNVYGALYNWYAVNTGKLCPAGWHAATDQDFKTLEIYLGMTVNQADSVYWRGTDQGTKMKSVSGWSLGGSGTNSSGFNALPAGYRFYEDGHFYDQGTTASFMTATEHTIITTILYRNLNSSYTTVFRKEAPKNAGKAVRCVMN